jgi:hypothetical protein
LGLEVSAILLRRLVKTFAVAGEPLVFGIDETLERRRGAKIAAKGIYRDPVRSSKSHFVKARAYPNNSKRPFLSHKIAQNGVIQIGSKDNRNRSYATDRDFMITKAVHYIDTIIEFVMTTAFFNSTV